MSFCRSKVSEPCHPATLIPLTVNSLEVMEASQMVIVSVESNASPAPAVRTFANTEEYDEWLRESLCPDSYHNVMEELKSFTRVKADMVRLLNFGTSVFPKIIEYRNFMNGLHLLKCPPECLDILEHTIAIYTD